MNGAVPYVSVLMITFNHEKYIAEAIESVLRQRAPFPYELVIGEDCSTDGTRATVERYRRENPQALRTSFRQHNLGFRRNFVETLRACRGRYVAVLEGDDYWLSPTKLARQVAILDAHPEYAICSSRAKVIYENGTQEPVEYPLTVKTEFTIEDLLRENMVPTCTAVFRRGLLLEIPAWMEELAFLDWPLFILLARAGDIFIVPEALAAYRIHPGGVWSRMSPREVAQGRRMFYDKVAENLPRLGGLIQDIMPGPNDEPRCLTIGR